MPGIAQAKARRGRTKHSSTSDLVQENWPLPTFRLGSDSRTPHRQVGECSVLGEMNGVVRAGGAEVARADHTAGIDPGKS